MRRVIYGVACSLDGFLAGPEGEIDWLHWTSDAERVMAEFWPRVDTMIMGRKTYEVGLSLGTNPDAMPGIAAAYVFSRTLTTLGSFERTHLVRSDAVEFVRDLKQTEGKGICLWGGGEFAGTLLDADLVDEIALNVHPILLGAGLPTFVGLTHRLPLRLVENRPMAGGCAMLTYERGR